jgi:uncharacterized coiled-coil DUF342 family protein
MINFENNKDPIENVKDVKMLKLDNKRIKHNCIDVIELIEKHIDEIYKVQMQAREFKKRKPTEIGKGNEILMQKNKELTTQEGQLKATRREIEFIQKQFSTDANYDLMVRTEDKIKNNETQL